MKKITAMILALMMCISLIIPASAASGTCFTIGGATANVGDTIKLPISFTSDVKVKAIGIDISKGYDKSVLKFTGFENEASFASDPIFETYDEDKQLISLGWNKAQDFSTGVKVCDICFEVIGKGSITVTGAPVVKNESGTGDITVATPEASVKVTMKQFAGITFAGAEYTYDGTAKVLAVSGAPADATVTYTCSNFDDDSKAINAGAYNIIATVKKDGYDDWTDTKTLKINPKELTITGLSAQNKTYDGTDKATLSESTLNGVISGDDVTANIPTEGKFADKNVGTNKAVTIDTIALSGKKSGNYTLTQPTGLKANITQKEISVIADNKQIKIGDEIPKLTYQADDLIEPDKFSGELAVATDGKTVNDFDITQGTLTAGDNYKINYTKGILSVTDKTPQTITVADFGEKTYGDTAFTISVTPDATSNLSNFTYTSDDENVAKISADGTITIVGAGEANITVTEAGNADYAQATVTKKLTVAKKALEIKVDDIEITYGEEINPNISYNGFITDEDETVLTKPVAVSGYSAKPNVGTYTITLNGAEAANYEISYTGATLTVNKKNITVTALKVFDKAADETTNATINTSSLVFDGMILGDDVSIDLENANATFAQATTGDDIAVTITDLALTGADAGNYNLTNNKISTTANIEDSITAADIATQINAVSVVTDSTEIKLPNVPTGYKIVVKSSDNEDVIKADGTVAPVESNTDVKLTFSIINENDETDVAETGEITVTVPASTKVKVDVTAEANGTVTGSGEYLKNSEVTVVATPDSGYKFDGWYNGDTSVSTSASYTFRAESDITLVAKFSRKSTGGGGGGGSSVSTYTVKFETNGGSTIDSVKVDKNKTVAEPTAPTKDGFEFAGWYADKALTTKYDFDTKVTKGITLYAAWTEKKTENKDDNTEPTEPTTPENKITFTDVKENDWFCENVKYVFENGLMNGTTDTEFAPNENLTRAMLVTILYRAESEPEVNKSIPFADITADSYYANAVIWAQRNGIISGVNENEFAPDENITREQIATIIYRYANYKGYDTSAKADISSFTDADEISDYATEAMQYAVASGLIKGKTETTLNPQDNATRAEIAAILQRFIEANK